MSNTYENVIEAVTESCDSYFFLQKGNSFDRKEIIIRVMEMEGADPNELDWYMNTTGVTIHSVNYLE